MTNKSSTECPASAGYYTNAVSYRLNHYCTAATAMSVDSLLSFDACSGLSTIMSSCVSGLCSACNAWVGVTPAPTKAPTNAPTKAPTKGPTSVPTKAPTNWPTNAPTNPVPTQKPTTAAPTTPVPTQKPTTAAPTTPPTAKPTLDPAVSYFGPIQDFLSFTYFLIFLNVVVSSSPVQFCSRILP